MIIIAIGNLLIKILYMNTTQNHIPPIILLSLLSSITLIKPALADNILPEVKIISDPLQDEISYQGKTTSRIGKAPLLLKDIPQSISIISESLIQDRAANTFKEAVRGMAGLTFNAGEGGRIGDNITLRGYSAAGDLYLDGLRDMAQYNRESFNLEQIEVLRGSASMLYGRGSTGGLINQVSKKPKKTDLGHFEASLGNWHHQRIQADINQALSGSIAVRINTMYTNNQSFRDEVAEKRWGLAPSISWGMGTRDEWNASYYILHEENRPDYGIPYFDGKPLNIAPNTFYGLSSDYERNQTHIGTLSHTHKFSDTSEWHTTIRKAHYGRDVRATAPRIIGSPEYITSTTLLNRQRQARGGTEHTWTIQSDYNKTLHTLGLQHELLTGIEYLNEQSTRWTNSSHLSNPQTSVLSPSQPILPSDFESSFKRTNFNHYQGQSYGIYLQDTIEIRPKWKLLMGTRFDQMTAHYQRPIAGDLSRKDKVWSYRSGLIYQPNEYTTYYSSWSTSFNPSAELYQLDERSQNTPPEKNHNIEFGTKWEILGGDLSLRSALFRSEKTHERNTDLATPDIALLSGKRHTDGFEFEAVGKITPQWEIIAAAAWMKSKIDRASGQQQNLLGKQPANTPNYTYSLWSTYKLNDTWKIGAGIDGMGQRYANANNTVVIPSHTRIDAMIQNTFKWSTSHKLKMKLNLFNAFNKKYYEGIYAGHVLPGRPRTLQLTFDYSF
jgi:catecholate siderophore receptor